MIKKLLLSLAVICVLLLSAIPVTAAEVSLQFFWASGCPHCAKEKAFLQTLTLKYPQLVIKDYEITESKKNYELLKNIGMSLDADVSGVPFTLIEDTYFTGYLNDETTGKEIELAIKLAFERQTQVSTRSAESSTSGYMIPKIPEAQNNEHIEVTKKLESIHVPIFGTLLIRDFSLPVLTIIIALLDGFNPCAMWALLFLISLLLGMKDRKRMWILGVTFIVSSGLVYFLFLSAWLNIFLFLGLIVWVRLVIGILAIGAGYYYLRDFWVNREGGCKVMGNSKRQELFGKIRAFAQKPNMFIAIIGMVILAFAVNLVELICSAGLPAIYTQLLSLSALPLWKYYVYLLLYIIIFMIDDLVVFFTAMITLQAIGVQSKYSRYSHLAGGILMLIIGILMIVKPEILMFG